MCRWYTAQNPLNNTSLFVRRKEWRNLKKTALFLTAALLGSSFTNLAFAKYPDIKGHWSEQFVELLSDKGIVHGDNYGNYRPDDCVKVDEFLKLTLEASGYEGKNVQGYWAEDYIKEAQSIFPNTKPGFDGKTTTIHFEE